MKKILVSILSFVLITTLSGCNSDNNSDLNNIDNVADLTNEVTVETNVQEEIVTSEDTNISEVESKTIQSAETQSAQEVNEQMPVPFEYSDGDMNVGFWEPCNMMFSGVPGSFMALRTGVSEWIESFPKISSYAPSDIFEYPTMYSFIAHFNISNDELEIALKAYLDEDSISREQFDIICSGDVEKMTGAFASEYAIVIGEKIYCPHWLYIHSIEEYKSAGITPDMILEKAPLFSDFNFTDEARVAFSDKLTAYIGETVFIEEPQYTEKTDEIIDDDSI